MANHPSKVRKRAYGLLATFAVPVMDPLVRLKGTYDSKFRIGANCCPLRNMNPGADAVHRIESMRVQLMGIERAVEDQQVRRTAADLQQKLIDLEMNLVDLRQTGTGQDGVRFGSKLLSKLNYLTGGVAASDFKPTDQVAEVRTILNAQLNDHLNALDLLITRDLQAFNDLLKSRNIPNIVVRPRSGVS